MTHSHDALETYSAFANAARRQRRVMGAVMLRNMRTRFFGHGLGYLIVIAWPLAHILLLVLIHGGTGRAPAYGDSAVLFVATGVVPFIAFSYTSRFMMVSLLTTKPLLAFPEVKVLDVLIAAALLESLASCCVLLFVVALGWAFNVFVWPHDVFDVASGFGAALLLGVGFGFFNGVVMLMTPLWLTTFTLFIIAMWILSGVFFVPSALPEPYRSIIAYNPVLQVVEWTRVGYLDGYTSLVLDRAFPVYVGVLFLTLGLVMERAMRGYVLASK